MGEPPPRITTPFTSASYTMAVDWRTSRSGSTVVFPPRSFIAATFIPIDESPGDEVKIGTSYLAAEIGRAHV